jgi:DNA-binding response OmpR family regulator
MGAEGPDDVGHEVLRFGEHMVDLRREVVVSPSGRKKLTTNEVMLLRYLAQRPGRPIARETLLEEVWGYARTVRSRAVDQTVKRLRPKIEVDPTHPRYLITVHGLGYRFELPQEEEKAPVPGLHSPTHRCLGSRVSIGTNASGTPDDDRMDLRTAV